MNSNENLKLAIFAGEIMLRNGAESFRVEDTVNRILNKFDYKTVETFTTTTGIFVSIEEADGEITTLIKRIHFRTINLNKIASVNDLSRRIVSGKIGLEDAQIELEKINNTITYSKFSYLLGWIFSCFGFSYVLNNSFYDATAALIVGIFSCLYFLVISEKKVSGVASNFTTSVVLSMVSFIVFKMGLGDNLDNIIIGGVMPLVPGVASVNAIRDMLNGDYLAASARLLDVILVAICIALGVGFSLTIATILGGL